MSRVVARLGVAIAFMLGFGLTAGAPGNDAFAAPLLSPSSSRPLVRAIFARKEFRFCHEPDYPLTPAEKEWCGLAADGDQVCPALRELCGKAASARQFEGNESFTIRWPALGATGRVALLGLVVLGMALLGLALVRQVHNYRSPRRTAIVRSTADPAGVPHARSKSAEVALLLARSRQAERAGDLRAAISHAYAALLGRLEVAGVLSITPDQTNGDYLRAIAKRRPVLAASVAELVSDVEASQFSGQAQPAPERCERVLARVMTIVDRVGEGP